MKVDVRSFTRTDGTACYEVFYAPRDMMTSTKVGEGFTYEGALRDAADDMTGALAWIGEQLLSAPPPRGWHVHYTAHQGEGSADLRVTSEGFPTEEDAFRFAAMLRHGGRAPARIAGVVEVHENHEEVE